MEGERSYNGIANERSLDRRALPRKHRGQMIKSPMSQKASEDGEERTSLCTASIEGVIMIIGIYLFDGCDCFVFCNAHLASKDRNRQPVWKCT